MGEVTCPPLFWALPLLPPEATRRSCLFPIRSQSRSRSCLPPHGGVPQGHGLFLFIWKAVILGI